MCSCVQNKQINEKVHTQLCYLATGCDYHSLITSNLENLAKLFWSSFNVTLICITLPSAQHFICELDIPATLADVAAPILKL